MAIDILGERQSGQDVRTQNGNCRHPFLPCLQIPPAGVRGSVRSIGPSRRWAFSALVTESSRLIAVMACGAVANIVKSSLGPVGLDKVCVSFTLIYLVFMTYHPCSL